MSKEIYSPELELKKENTYYSEASFLDLGVTIVHKKFNIQHYDKRDDFVFSTVTTLYLLITFPQMFFSAFWAGILWIARIPSKFETLYETWTA